MSEYDFMWDNIRGVGHVCLKKTPLYLFLARGQPSLLLHGFSKMWPKTKKPGLPLQVFISILHIQSNYAIKLKLQVDFVLAKSGPEVIKR